MIFKVGAGRLEVGGWKLEVESLKEEGEDNEIYFSAKL